MLKICVTGGRFYDDAAYVNAVLSLIWPFKLGQGGAPGADKLCERWTEMRDPCAVTTYPAEWKARGRAAGPLRNRFMLDDFQPHALLAFPGGRGTADCVAAAHERGIPVWHV